MTEGNTYVVSGTVSWQLRKDPKSGALIATCSPLKLVAWGHTMEDLTEYVVNVLGLYFAHLLKHDQLPFIESKGFLVQRFLAVPDVTRSPYYPVVNGTQSILHPALPQ